ncbi:MAG: Rpn family recombination-promoting nuclease/putative transposase [Planctomycetes bacterium]|nr:Rpn family recombination-promoting nuclease/putative transposase [Planctomycetota bacterium]
MDSMEGAGHSHAMDAFGIDRSALRNFPDRAIRSLLQSPGNVRALLHMAAPEIARGFNVSKLSRLERTFVQETFRQREADCILRLPYRPRDASPERDVWVFVLIEHQSDPDPLMAFRLLFSMAPLWEYERREQEERRVEALALSGETERWLHLTTFVIGYICHRRPAEEGGALLTATRSAAEHLRPHSAGCRGHGGHHFGQQDSFVPAARPIYNDWPVQLLGSTS